MRVQLPPPCPYYLPPAAQSLKLDRSRDAPAAPPLPPCTVIFGLKSLAAMASQEVAMAAALA